MPSNHLILCYPLPLLPSIFPSIKVFSNESALHIRWPKYWSFSFSISPLKECSGLISLRIGWFDPVVVQGTLKSLLQPYGSKTSILQHSAFLIIWLSYPYMTTGKTVAYTHTHIIWVLNIILKFSWRIHEHRVVWEAPFVSHLQFTTSETSLTQEKLPTQHTRMLERSIHLYMWRWVWIGTQRRWKVGKQPRQCPGSQPLGHSSWAQQTAEQEERQQTQLQHLCCTGNRSAALAGPRQSLQLWWRLQLTVLPCPCLLQQLLQARQPQAWWRCPWPWLPQLFPSSLIMVAMLATQTTSDKTKVPAVPVPLVVTPATPVLLAAARH